MVFRNAEVLSVGLALLAMAATPAAFAGDVVSLEIDAAFFEGKSLAELEAWLPPGYYALSNKSPLPEELPENVRLSWEDPSTGDREIVWGYNPRGTSWQFGYAYAADAVAQRPDDNGYVYCRGELRGRETYTPVAWLRIDRDGRISAAGPMSRFPRTSWRLDRLYYGDQPEDASRAAR